MMRRVDTGGFEVRIEDRHPPARTDEFLRDPERHHEPLRLWRETLEHVATAASIKRPFAAGFVLDDQRVALSADSDRGATICINPERLAEAIAKYGHEPLSLAAYLHSVACHELAHIDGRMGRGHDEEYIAAREELGASTAHTLPLIAELAACVLGLGPCKRRPTQVDEARQEAIRACQGGSCQVDPLDAAVASIIRQIVDQKPRGISGGYIWGFADRHGQRLRAVVRQLERGSARIQDVPRETQVQIQGVTGELHGARIIDRGKNKGRLEVILWGMHLGTPRTRSQTFFLDPDATCTIVRQPDVMESLPSRKRADVVRRVRAQLGPQHLRPDFRRARPEEATASWGCCYVAAEAVWHALGGPDSGLRPTFIRHEGAPHWYLVDVATGEPVDPTADQFSSPPDYARGTGKGFLTLAPSQRAQAILSAARL